MVDHFSVFAEPRRPWIDQESLKQKFQRLSADVHPDRVHDSDPARKERAQESYIRLNEAYRCLSSPRELIRHLVELETGQRPSEVRAVPDGLMELFMEISPLLGEGDALIAGKAKAVSPLLKVRLLEQSQDTLDRLRNLQSRLESQRVNILNALKSAAASWESPTTEDWGTLENHYRRLSYLNRWSIQIREKIIQMTL